MKFSSIELQDLGKAWIAISISFSVLLNSSFNFLTGFIIAGITVGSGFLLHELAHKMLAQKYRCFAEFRSFDFMLVLSIIMSFFGFIFVAPGAVMISGNINKEKNGKISLVGPLTNLLLAIIFFFVSFSAVEIIKVIGNYGFIINSWLAIFNLIPVWQFDGKKVYLWNKLIYFSVLMVAIIIMVLGQI